MTDVPALRLYTLRYCPWCDRARAVLRRTGIPFEEMSIDHDPVAGRQLLARMTGGRSDVPQAFVGDVYVGDDDDLSDKIRTGELQRLMAQSG